MAELENLGGGQKFKCIMHGRHLWFMRGPNYIKIQEKKTNEVSIYMIKKIEIIQWVAKHLVVYT